MTLAIIVVLIVMLIWTALDKEKYREESEQRLLGIKDLQKSLNISRRNISDLKTDISSRDKMLREKDEEFEELFKAFLVFADEDNELFMLATKYLHATMAGDYRDFNYCKLKDFLTKEAVSVTVPDKCMDDDRLKSIFKKYYTETPGYFVTKPSKL